MLNIKKLIVIPQNAFNNNPTDINIPIILSKEYSPSIQNATNIETLSVKRNDLISINLTIENHSLNPIESLKLTIKNDPNFTYVPGSILNTDTKEGYSPETINSTTIALDKLIPNQTINLQFYIKANLNCLNSDTLTNYLILLPYSSTPESPYREYTQPLLASIAHAVLQINTDVANGNINIENSGLSSIKNMYLRYSNPHGFYSDISALTSTVNNKPTQIAAAKIDNDILFVIDNIPESLNGKPSKVGISFKSENKNSIHSVSLIIK